MSRTNRKHVDFKHYAHGRFWTIDEIFQKESFSIAMGWGSYVYVIDRNGRDKKANDKPDSIFKRIKRRKEKAQVKHAIRNGRDIPKFRKTDCWEFN
jgi:hypothetical protein